MLKRAKNTSKSVLDVYSHAKAKLSLSEQVKFSQNKSVKNFWGNSFPSIVNFAQESFATNYSGDPIIEWKYLIACCIHYKERILAFIDLKKEFELNILNGDFENAELSLSLITEKYGESLWSINATFLLSEKQGGREANWQKLSEIIKTKDDALFRLIIELVSKKNESLIRFDEFLKSTHEQISILPFDDYIKQFVYYCLGIKSINNPLSSGILIYLFSGLPVIDRYLFLTRFSELLYISCDSETFKPFLYPIRSLYKTIGHNTILRNILLYENQVSLNDIMIDTNEFEYFEAYLSGDIERAASIIENLIVNEFRLKYLIDYYTLLPSAYSAKTFGINNSLLNELSRTISGVIDKGQLFVSTLRMANKLELQMSDFVDLSCFTFFVGRENTLIDSAPYFNLLRALDDENVGPSMLLYFNGPHEIKATKDLCKRIDAFPMVSSLVEKLNNFDNSNINLFDAQTFEKLFFADLLTERKDFITSIQLLESVLISENLYESSIAFLKIMEIYLEERRFRALLLHFEKFLTIKPGFFERVNLEFICKEIDDSDFENLEDLIITPIIFSKAQISAHSIYGALDSFLSFHGVSKPSSLFDATTKFERGYFLLLLNEVCVIEVIKYLTVFESTTEVENERLIILKYLADSEFPEKKAVIDEFVEVAQREVIRKGLRNYNSGKITTDFLQLRRHITEKLSSSFSRFKDQKLFVDDSTYKSVDYENQGQVKVILDLNSLGTINRYISLKDPSFLSLKLIVNEMRDIFLNSKEHGLDGHLSTRIRHGMLINHIKRVFVNHNLLAVKEGNLFNDINFWEYVLFEKPDAYNPLQIIFQEFSIKLDEYCQKLRSEYIQIKTEKDLDKPNALFDFSFNPEFYMRLYAVVEEHNIESSEFVEYCLFALLQITNINLENVRRYLRETVNSDLRIMLEEIKIKIQELFQDHLHSGIITQVNKAATDITYELENISRWFHLADEDTEFKLQFTDIISIAVKVSNILYPTFQLNPTIKANSNEKLTCSIGIIDILRNLIENVVVHSECLPEDLDLKIDGYYSNDDGVVKITMSHRLGNGTNVQEIKERFIEYNSQWNNKDFYGDRISNEGKSGIKKIRRSIEYDLGASESSFEFTLNNYVIIISVTFNIPKL